MLDDLLQMMMQSQQAKPAQGQTPPQNPAAAGNPLGDLLGGILGGMAGGQTGAGGSGLPQPANAPSGGGMGMLGGLMDAFMGGGGSAAPGMAGGMGANPMLAPITEAVSEKLGISQQMAAVIVSAGFAMLMSKMTQMGKPAGDRSLSTQDLDLDEMMDADYLKESGIATRVAQQTGLDEETAVSYLQQATGMMAGQQSAPESAPKSQDSAPSELDNLLDTWQTD